MTKARPEADALLLLLEEHKSKKHQKNNKTPFSLIALKAVILVAGLVLSAFMIKHHHITTKIGQDRLSPKTEAYTVLTTPVRSTEASTTTSTTIARELGRKKKKKNLDKSGAKKKKKKNKKTRGSKGDDNNATIVVNDENKINPDIGLEIDCIERIHGEFCGQLVETTVDEGVGCTIAPQEVKLSYTITNRGVQDPLAIDSSTIRRHVSGATPLATPQQVVTPISLAPGESFHFFDLYSWNPCGSINDDGVVLEMSFSAATSMECLGETTALENCQNSIVYRISTLEGEE